MLFNLVSNAIKFSSPDRDGRITVSSDVGRNFPIDGLEANKEYCHICVKDNGIGFEDKYEDQLFDFFKKFHGSDKYEGTGFGLSIVKKIIENHDGVIVAKGALNKGAAFHIYLPNFLVD